MTTHTHTHTHIHTHSLVMGKEEGVFNTNARGQHTPTVTMTKTSQTSIKHTTAYVHTLCHTPHTMICQTHLTSLNFIHGHDLCAMCGKWRHGGQLCLQHVCPKPFEDLPLTGYAVAGGPTHWCPNREGAIHHWKENYTCILKNWLYIFKPKQQLLKRSPFIHP